MKLTSLLVFCSVLFCTTIQAQNKPNIILVIADDLGWSQVSSDRVNLNNPSDFYETPNIASLANEGISFPHGYANAANCAPTRAALLSGQYASRATNNVFNVNSLNRGGDFTLLLGPSQGISNGEDEIPGNAITLAETIKTAGYTTAHFGKYHVGGSIADNKPEQQGFDYNYGGGSAGRPGSYFASESNNSWTFSSFVGPELDVFANPYTASESMLLAGDNSLTGTKKHLTDAMADAAITFMTANKDKPFFMHFSNYAVHGPFTTENARPDLKNKYAAKNNTNPSQMGHTSIGQAAIAEGMDQTIGRLVTYLKTTDDPRNTGEKLAENTLVYFISDNGGAIDTSDNGPLRGMKGDYYEGGIRSVTFAWTEGDLLANKGTVNSTPVVAFDLYPTFVDMADGNLPNDYAIDGVSLWPMLNGTNPAISREAIYWHFPGYLKDSKRDVKPVSVIRKGDYKLIYNYETETYELYHLINDISETTNLLNDTPTDESLDIGNDLSTDLLNYLVTINAPLPKYRNNRVTVPLPTVIDKPITEPSVICITPSTYLAYWSFDKTKNLNDSSINGHDPLATVGAITYDDVDFKQGDQSAVFNGSSNVRYGDRSGSFLTEATTARTISFWVKPVNINGIQELYEEGGRNNGVGMRLNEGNLETILKNKGVSNELSTAFPNDGEWHHVALVYDGSITSHKLYLDGNLMQSNTSAPVIISRHNADAGIGSVHQKDPWSTSDKNYFTGKMDGFGVHGIALTEEQVKVIYRWSSC